MFHRTVQKLIGVSEEKKLKSVRRESIVNVVEILVEARFNRFLSCRTSEINS